MIKALRAIGLISLVAGIVMGIIIGNQPDPILREIDRFYEASFRWSAALSWWLGGIVLAIVFFAYARILELQEETHSLARWIVENVQTKPQEKPQPLGNSKASLSKLSGFKMGGSNE
jgi:ABC-type dipeptide/oligopeptide/nickel transport system permease component